MMTTRRANTRATIVSLLAAVAVGCAPTTPKTGNPVVAATRPSVEPGATENPIPVEPTRAVLTSSGEMLRGSLYFPTGQKQGSVLLLEKDLPSEITAGRAFEYTIKVTNVSQLDLDGVEVEETFPSSLKPSEGGGATPTTAPAAAAPASGPQTATYRVGVLAPGQSKTITRVATATQAGALGMCLTARYDTSLCMATTVVSPAIKLMVSAPADGLICEPVPYKLSVMNSGSGTARNVRVEAALPAGMTTSDGKNSIAINAGTLAAGEAKEFAVAAKVNKTGKYDLKASVKADDGLNNEAPLVSTQIKQPVLAVTKTGADKAFIGQPIAYEITVTNKGDAIAKNVQLFDNLPASATIQTTNENGRADTTGKVKWELGEIAPGASKKVAVVITVGSAGKIDTACSASAQCAETVAALASTVVTGVPAVLLEVTDNPDPVKVGGETTYFCEITNQGSAPGTNIKLVVVLEDSMQYVKADGGPSTMDPDGKTITFQPLPTLAPKAKQVYKITVRGTKAADSRFKATLTSDQLGRPVEETEATTIYQ